MGFVIVTVLAFIFLDWPWRALAVLAAAAYEGFEILLWLRWRKKRSTTGIESLVGTRGKAIGDLRPEGQVRVRGQIWKARCAEGADAGDDVVVAGVDGLRLEVRPGSLPHGAPSSSGRAPDF
jgi:membrane-bound serine protease (ClpP class)